MITSYTKKRRDGLSLIEVIVVLAVIGILVALILPAIQGAREAARRAVCFNNLKQIGVAVQAYQAAFGCYPLANTPTLYSVNVAILPFLEARAIYDSVNFTFDAFSPPAENETVSSLRFAIYLCPSDSFPGVSPLGGTSYVGNRGVGVQKFGYNGLFATSFQPPVRDADILDGTSQTACASEQVFGVAAGNDPRRRVLRVEPSLPRPNQFDSFAVTCQSLVWRGGTDAWPDRGLNWLAGEFGYTLYNHTLTPNSHSCLNGTRVQEGAWTTGSFHDGNVHLLFADGHTRAVKDSIDLSIWRSLGSRNGREIIDTGRLE
jgi:prepilin-type N-terminal cleavage/methylation domain-containing protein/prepilin-type processing-associated H-X9-DG protein